MKNLSFNLIAFLLVMVIVSSCKDEEEDKGPTNYFTYKGKKIALTKGTVKGYSPVEDDGDLFYRWSISFTSSGVFYEGGGDFSGKGDAILMDMYSINDESRLPAGKYTYTPGAGEHLAHDAIILININFADPDETEYVLLEDADDMEITVAKSGDNDIITFTAVYAGETITCTFTGPLVESE